MAKLYKYNNFHWHNKGGHKYNHFHLHNKGGHKLTTLYDCNKNNHSHPNLHEDIVIYIYYIFCLNEGCPCSDRAKACIYV